MVFNLEKFKQIISNTYIYSVYFGLQDTSHDDPLLLQTCFPTFHHQQQPLDEAVSFRMAT